LKQNDYTRAVADETQAITLVADYGFAYSHRGAARYYLSDFKGAVDDETQALRIDPTDSYASQYRDAAVKQMRRATAPSPDALATMHAELVRYVVAGPRQLNIPDAPPREPHRGKVVLDPQPRPHPVDGAGAGPKEWPTSKPQQSQVKRKTP
jgi:hypothetical protein